MYKPLLSCNAGTYCSTEAATRTFLRHFIRVTLQHADVDRNSSAPKSGFKTSWSEVLRYVIVSILRIACCFDSMKIRL